MIETNEVALRHHPSYFLMPLSLVKNKNPALESGGVEARENSRLSAVSARKSKDVRLSYQGESGLIMESFWGDGGMSHVIDTQVSMAE